MRNVSTNQQGPSTVAGPGEFSQSIDWYHEGDTLLVEVNGVQVAVSYVRRKGRRCRLAITAPPGATFRSVEPKGSVARSVHMTT
jgi:hypothetical protein